MNRAVAIAELDGPGGCAEHRSTRWRLVDAAITLWHASRADLLRRLGRSSEARAAYDAAIALTANPTERAYLTRRRAELR